MFFFGWPGVRTFYSNRPRDWHEICALECTNAQNALSTRGVEVSALRGGGGVKRTRLIISVF